MCVVLLNISHTYRGALTCKRLDTALPLFTPDDHIDLRMSVANNNACMQNDAVQKNVVQSNVQEIREKLHS